MEKKVADKPATPRELAPLFGGGGATVVGVVDGVEGREDGVAAGEGGVAVEGGVAGEGGVAREGDGAVLLLPETLMASFWPASQWPGNAHVK